mgnify:CR=1 FL=1
MSVVKIVAKLIEQLEDDLMMGSDDSKLGSYLDIKEPMIMADTDTYAIQSSFSQWFSDNGLDNIDVQIEQDEDDTIVYLSDDDGDSETIVFGTDDDGSNYAIVKGENEEESEEGTFIELDTMNAPLSTNGGVDLSTINRWGNRSLLGALLGVGNIGDDEVIGELEGAEVEEPADEPADEFGEEPFEDDSMFPEAYKVAIRGGKKVKIPIRVRKKILTAKQKLGLAKARRTAHTATAKRHGAMSNKARKQAGLK